MAKRSRWRWAAIILAGIVVVWWLSRWWGPLSRPGLPASRSAGEVVRLLVRAEASDESNWRNRGQFSGGHLTGFLGSAIWEVIFPVRYAKERIFLLGREAIEPLLRLVGDRSEGAGVRRTAWYVLVEFDDPRIREEILRQLECGELTPLDAAWVLHAHLPIDIYSPLLEEARVLDWLKENRNKTYEELCLSLLDDLLKSEESIRGTYVSMPRWLNRMHDQDLDTWFAEKAPDALEFRNRELARGYDPLVCLERLSLNLTDGIIDQGIKAVFVDPKDQAACHRLLTILDYTVKSPLSVPETAGWEGRLVEWYRKHRNELTYDHRKHRFVVKAGAGENER